MAHSGASQMLSLQNALTLHALTLVLNAEMMEHYGLTAHYWLFIKPQNLVRIARREMAAHGM